MTTFSDILSSRGISLVGKSTNIADATAVGRAVLTADTAAAQLTAISSGILSVSAGNLTSSGAVIAANVVLANAPSGAAYLRMYAASAVADGKYSEVINDASGNFTIRMLNDAYSTASPILNVTRVAGAPAAVYIYGTSVAINAPLTIPTPAVGDTSTLAATTSFVGTALTNFGGQTPIGGIIHYFGNVSDIPSNWKVCDGSTATIRGASVTLPDMRGKFAYGVSSGNALATTGGAASNTPTIAGTALTVAQLPAHNHAISDPGHAHSVADGGHAHTTGNMLTGQSTGANQGTSPVTNNTGGNIVIRNFGNGHNTDAAGTGIGIYSAGTGISIQNNGSGSTHTHTSSAVPTIPPYVSLMFIIRIS